MTASQTPDDVTGAGETNVAAPNTTPTANSSCSDPSGSAHAAPGASDNDGGSAKETVCEKHSTGTSSAPRKPSGISTSRWPYATYKPPPVPHPPWGPTPGYPTAPSVSIPANEKHPERVMNDSESKQYWYEQCYRQKDEIKKWKERAEAQRERAETEAKKLAGEKERLEKLRASHVRAVNSVDAGLEPVADQSFVERLSSLHHEVCTVRMWRRTWLTELQVHTWCRRGFKKGEYEPQPELQLKISPGRLLESRVDDISVLSLPRLVDCLAWAYMETYIFSLWFPGLHEDKLKFMAELEDSIREGGTFSSGPAHPSSPH